MIIRMIIYKVCYQIIIVDIFLFAKTIEHFSMKQSQTLEIQNIDPKRFNKLLEKFQLVQAIYEQKAEFGYCILHDVHGHLVEHIHSLPEFYDCKYDCEEIQLHYQDERCHDFFVMFLWHENGFLGVEKALNFLALIGMDV